MLTHSKVFWALFRRRASHSCSQRVVQCAIHHAASELEKPCDFVNLEQARETCSAKSSHGHVAATQGPGPAQGTWARSSPAIIFAGGPAVTVLDFHTT